MKTYFKDILSSMPNSLKVFFIVLFVIAAAFPKTLLALIVMVPVNFLFIIIAITRSGQFHFLITMIICFAIAYLLRKMLPESSKHLAKCWLLISFMLCLSYGHIYYLDQNLFAPGFPYHADVAFLLCCLPGFLGLWMGKRLKSDYEEV